MFAPADAVPAMSSTPGFGDKMMNVGAKLAVRALYADEVKSHVEPAKSGSSAIFFQRFWLKNQVTLLSTLVDLVSQMLSLALAKR